MYVSAPHLMDQLELGKFHKDDAALEFREVIFGCDLLVIDDLGTELVTRYTQAEVYDLVNHRLNTGKPTIINTNLGLQEIERTYSSRVHSRLAGMYAVVQFRGGHPAPEKAGGLTMKDRAQDRSQRRACTGRFCTIFYCDKVQASRCCADCDRQCANACQNHPSRCGLEDKARRRRGRKC